MEGGIAEQVCSMTPEAAERLARSCVPLRLVEDSGALNARIDELVTRREALA